MNYQVISAINSGIFQYKSTLMSKQNSIILSGTFKNTPAIVKVNTTNIPFREYILLEQQPLKHHSIAKFLAIGTIQSWQVIVMCKYNGDLADVINRVGLISMPAIEYIGRSILEGICYLKKINIIHNDIKPDNIVYDKYGVYLIDFDAISRGERVSRGTMEYASLTAHSHMATTSRDDVESLVYTLFALKAGKILWWKLPRKRIIWHKHHLHRNITQYFIRHLFLPNSQIQMLMQWVKSDNNDLDEAVQLLPPINHNLKPLWMDPHYNSTLEVV